MPRRRGPRSNPEGIWPAYLPEGGRDTPQGPCRSGCCKTPYGHSTLIIGCACHQPTPRLMAATRRPPNPEDAA